MFLQNFQFNVTDTYVLKFLRLLYRIKTFSEFVTGNASNHLLSFAVYR